MSKPTIAISSDFLTAFAKLPKGIQRKTTDFLTKFRDNPSSGSIHLHLIKNSDPCFRSARIDQTYRGIVARQDASDTYLLLWVDHHDEAYAWASKRKCSINDITGSVQVYEVFTERVHIAQPQLPPLFSAFTDDQLIKLGTPRDQLHFLRTLTTVQQFDEIASSIPEDVREALEYLANGLPYAEVLEEVARNANDGPASDSFSDALRNASSLRSFVVVEGEDELLKLLSAPLEKWRTFLHPSQRAVVSKSYNGPARVLGGAGTGKTVVAMHRARKLAKECKPGQRVLFTTFSTNLATDISGSLDELCSPDERRCIDVDNLDRWALRFLRSRGITYDVIYDEETILELWSDAINSSETSLEYGPEFYASEWSEVITALDELTLERYVQTRRSGRGGRLPRAARIQVWNVVERYRSLLNECGMRDIDSAMTDARSLIEHNPNLVSYESVVVDEAQDFSCAALRLIRAIAGSQHENDIFIVGDSHQRIYRKRTILSHCGINVRGRSKRLCINYRTPEQIRKAAIAVIAGLNWDDLDGGSIVGVRDEVAQSLIIGERPVMREFPNKKSEVDWIAACITNAINSGLDSRDACVVLRTNSLANNYAEELMKRGIDVALLGSKQSDDRSLSGVRVATMHRVKGLEFDTVFLAGMNEDAVPPHYMLEKARKTRSEQEVLRVERSLVYVAMTRAKRTTVISSSQSMTKLLDGI